MHEFHNSPVMVKRSLHVKTAMRIALSVVIMSFVALHVDVAVIYAIGALLVVRSYHMQLAKEKSPPSISDYVAMALLSGFIPVLTGYFRALLDKLASLDSSYLTLFGDNRRLWGDVLRGLGQNNDFILTVSTGLLVVAITIGLLVATPQLFRTYKIRLFSDSGEGTDTTSAVDQLVEDFRNPMMEESPSRQILEPAESSSRQTELTGEASHDPLKRMAIAAKMLYTQYEMPTDDNIVIYFENGNDYVDSFIEVTTKKTAVASVNLAFTIPPNQENSEWVSYNVEISDPEGVPQLILCDEIDQKGATTALEPQYYDWLADCIEAVLALPETVNGERPSQQAPTTMY